MFDGEGRAPDLDLLLSPGDEAELIGPCLWPARSGLPEVSRLYLVLHRRHGAWTHAYRVVPDRRPGHLTVHLLRVAEGDQRDTLRAWLQGRIEGVNRAAGQDAGG